jgi:hypothetical protein
MPISHWDRGKYAVSHNFVFLRDFMLAGSSVGQVRGTGRRDCAPLGDPRCDVSGHIGDVGRQSSSENRGI